jgi:hypothetical protein
MRVVLREPVVHFVALGAVLFAANALFAPKRESPKAAVVSTTIRVPKELSGEDKRKWIDEEVLYREGLARGLEKDDPKIKQRIAGNMQRVLEGQIVLAKASDAELRAFFDANQARWAKSELYDFTNVFVADSDQKRAGELLAQLSGGADPNGMGDTFSGGRKYRKRALEDLGEAFGPEFVAGLADQKPGTWAIRRSRHGLHVIRVDAKTPAQPPSFDAMRGEIEVAYDEKRRNERLASAVADLRKKYAVE